MSTLVLSIYYIVVVTNQLNVSGVLATDLQNHYYNSSQLSNIMQVILFSQELVSGADDQKNLDAFVQKMWVGQASIESWVAGASYYGDTASLGARQASIDMVEKLQDAARNWSVMQ